MNENIHRVNDIIKQVPDLRYDSSTGLFETDRRALYDFAELIIKECSDIACEYDAPKMSGPGIIIAGRIETHFGIEEPELSDADRILQTVRTRGGQ